jgi:hypothetical protein
LPSKSFERAGESCSILASLLDASPDQVQALGDSRLHERAVHVACASQLHHFAQNGLCIRQALPRSLSFFKLLAFDAISLLQWQHFLALATGENGACGLWPLVVLVARHTHGRAMQGEPIHTDDAVVGSRHVCASLASSPTSSTSLAPIAAAFSGTAKKKANLCCPPRLLHAH